MDTVTYPHAAVKKELSHWVRFPVDIAVRNKVAELFNVVGIPVAVALTANGNESGRIEGFVEPMKFKSQLEQLRQKKNSSNGQTNGTSTLTDLSKGEKELKTAFNRDKGYVRLVLILSPS